MRCVTLYMHPLYYFKNKQQSFHLVALTAGVCNGGAVCFICGRVSNILKFVTVTSCSMAASRPWSKPKLCPTERLLASRSSDGRLPNSDYEPQVLYNSRLLSYSFRRFLNVGFTSEEIKENSLYSWHGTVTNRFFLLLSLKHDDSSLWEKAGKLNFRRFVQNTNRFWMLLE